MTDAAAVLAAATSEDQLLATVCEALTLRGWRWTHSRRGDRAITMGNRGLPDIVAVRGNRLAFIELKTETGRLTLEQKLWLRDLGNVAYGGAHNHHDRPVPETWVCRPSTLDILLENLR